MMNGFVADSVDVSSLGEIVEVRFGVTLSATGIITVSRRSLRKNNGSGEAETYLYICFFGYSITSDSLGVGFRCSSFQGCFLKVLFKQQN